MRWLPFIILAYLALGLQIGLSKCMSIGTNSPAEPNLVLPVVIFIAIWAPRDAALLACFTLGLLQDLATLQPLGLNALTYGLVGMFTVSTQQLVYRAHPLTHFSLALMGALLGSFIILLHGWIRGPSMGSMFMSLFYSSLYTAVIAPIVLGVLGKMKKGFAFQPARRKLRM